MELDERGYRIVYNSFRILGSIIPVSLVVVGQYLVGSMVFLVFSVGYAVFEQKSKEVSWDERDRKIAGAASGYTLRVVGIVSMVVFPVLGILHYADYYEWRPWATHSFVVVATISVMYGILNFYFSTKF